MSLNPFIGSMIIELSSKTNAGILPITYNLSLFTKNEKNLFLETEQPICNINDSNTFILIFVVSSTGNYHFGISILDL